MWPFKNKEQRSLENPSVPISQATVEAAAWLFGGGLSASGFVVNEKNVLGIPAYLCGQQFLSKTIASLPLNIYQKTGEGREKTTGTLQNILRKSVNNTTTAYNWRKYVMERVLTGGRSITFIERNGRGDIINLWPLVPSRTTIKRVGGRNVYEYRDSEIVTRVYGADEVLDFYFSLKEDGFSTRSPISTCTDALSLGIASNAYASKLFQNGGVPPFLMTGNFQTAGALKRSAEEVEKAIRSAAKELRQVLSLPAGHDLKALGIDPDKLQMIETKRFVVEEVARILNLPPSFLQDLTHGTFSNVEQQDLQLVKHTVTHWATMIEQEINLKFFGRDNEKFYAEFNLDGLLRGDFLSRMQGYATGIQNAIYKPSDVHKKENLKTEPEADKYYIQGATVPLGTQPMIGNSDD